MSTDYSNVEEYVNYALQAQEKSIKELVSSVNKQMERGDWTRQRSNTNQQPLQDSLLLGKHQTTDGGGQRTPRHSNQRNHV